jgi:hypothetical protein
MTTFVIIKDIIVTMMCHDRLWLSLLLLYNYINQSVLCSMSESMAAIGSENAFKQSFSCHVKECIHPKYKNMFSLRDTMCSWLFCVCVHTLCMYVCMYVHVYVCMCVCARMHLCMYIHVYICMYVCVCTYSCIYTYIYIYILHTQY